MKRLMAVAVAATLGLALNAGAAEVKQETKVKKDESIQKTEVKAGETKIERTSTTTPDMKITETKAKGPKGNELEATKTVTASGASGDVMFKSKSGIIKKYNVAWKYYMQGSDYIIEYTVKDKMNTALAKDAGFPTNEVKPGTYKITSTSPYTISDEEADLAKLIAANMKTQK